MASFDYTSSRKTMQDFRKSALSYETMNSKLRNIFNYYRAWSMEFSRAEEKFELYAFLRATDPTNLK